MSHFDPTDPRHISPEQRLEEIAAILAIGMRRLLALNPSTASKLPQQNPQESEPSDLELSAESRLHVPRG